jgi:hypothetical protein
MTRGDGGGMERRQRTAGLGDVIHRPAYFVASDAYVNGRMMETLHTKKISLQMQITQSNEPTQTEEKAGRYVEE